ncbi:hypothetical protein H112_01472 [Trichophyton rubrum D6]|uniref:Uncharacterized protein n=2 Tax=Trichophyton rubrum TaxID=5551 RepID=F2SX17_TRIRC|nr:uncharacterized protein TERG_07113 [Trichophyton rubrum CBS 118892]EZF26405.1 hypothetical protein H100_01467 [Trichophyton rubrum MR850]EZF45284.1 hypothetical protein H102_01463 [Trichophyton rubrum CBS 100081]EZF56034.1 hypothetical protein H103_01476 [Trichophyton rubrum CBS 288.86]EZF66685.1 hypothetical protein H104_01452 [Trichophyton rubrum CBS 289.86]EZF87995.1 hypothetical protein H110_01472 [Trichophyton rubrum MR1448]EZF98616.1 hypothetical protein H113_01477 [Trichophyton rubr
MLQVPYTAAWPVCDDRTESLDQHMDQKATLAFRHPSALPLLLRRPNFVPFDPDDPEDGAFLSYICMGQIVNCKGPGIQLINSIGTRLHLRATTLRPPPQAAQQCEEDELSWLLPCCARGLGSSAKGSVRREGAGTAPSAAASSMDGSH